MNKPPKTTGFIARGGAWVLVQFVLMITAIVLAIACRGAGAALGVRGIGAVSFLAGAVFGVAGVRVLGRNRTPFPQPREGSELVQRGIYAQVRHPLYTSVMLVSLGWALLWQSWPALVAAVMLIPFFHAKARREEGWLRQRFPGYTEYAHRVPRFIPRLRSRRAAVPH